MSEKPITPLRQRMLEDMSVCRFTPATQRQYIGAVKRLAAFLGRSPDTATQEELRAFQLHLTGTGVQPTSINATAGQLDLAEDGQFLEFLLNPRVSNRVALNHERRSRLGCLVRVAGIEERRRVVLNPELDSLRDLRSSKFGNDAEGEVNSRSDATCCEDIAVAYDSRLFVTGADQRQ